MRFWRITALLIICGIALPAVGESRTAQTSASKPARTEQNDIPTSIAESVSGPLQFTEGSLLGLAEAMPEDKYSFVPTAASLMMCAASASN